MIKRFLTKWSGLLLLPILLIGCGEDPQQTMLRNAVAIESADECHLCGMIISNFTGPKGESYQKDKQDINKFCSTRDLFAFLFQPENARLVQEVYVHDMSQSPWNKPNDEHFIDAKTAWYVIGSNQKGAMGSTLASFSEENDAKAFSKSFGGKVYQYEDITLELIM